MVGNSSSGLWEAPSLNLPVVNIGNRQEGRLRARNVIDVAETAVSIRAGIRKALVYDRTLPCVNPYGDGRSSARIRKFVKDVFARKNREAILKKKFTAVGKS
jgi:UDP-N-acetylglucosamine 2-epimerase